MSYQGQSWAGNQFGSGYQPRGLPPMHQPPTYQNGQYPPSQQSPYEHSRYQNGHHLPQPRQRDIYYPSQHPADASKSSPQYSAPSPQHSAPPPPRQSQPTSPVEQPSDVAPVDPRPTTRSWKGHAYLLEVRQQPDRARMCGFGDKDRRPISPPPCIRLIIIDEKTGKEIDYTKVEDLSRFILIVDLADVESLQESNLVHHLSSANPSIGSTFPGAYPHTQAAAPSGPAPTDYDARGFPGYEAAYQTNGYSANGSAYRQSYTSPHVAAYPAPAATSSGSCSRNLIGSLSATAFRLYDTEGSTGLWFVFQDLSIRTEGMFRLKFTFFDLMCQRDPLAPPSGDALANYSPLLASAYSAPFQVWSAKKFPGVRQTTELSQCFADQGIKIPVRKSEGKGDEKKRKRGGGGDSGDEDDEEEE